MHSLYLLSLISKVQKVARLALQPFVFLNFSKGYIWKTIFRQVLLMAGWVFAAKQHSGIDIMLVVLVSCEVIAFFVGGSLFLSDAYLVCLLHSFHFPSFLWGIFANCFLLMTTSHKILQGGKDCKDKNQENVERMFFGDSLPCHSQLHSPPPPQNHPQCIWEPQVYLAVLKVPTSFPSSLLVTDHRWVAECECMQNMCTMVYQRLEKPPVFLTDWDLWVVSDCQVCVWPTST